MAKKSVKMTGMVIVNSTITPTVSGTILKADDNFLTMRIRRKGSSKHEVKIFRKEDVVTIWAEEGTSFNSVSGQADVCLKPEVAKLDGYKGNLSVTEDGWFACKNEDEERIYLTNPAYTKFIADDTEEEEEAPKKKKKVDDDEDEAPKKKKKKVDDDDEDEKPKKKKKPADDDEDEAPKKKKKPADDDDDEDEAPKKKKKPADDDDEDEKPKKKKKPADDDDDEDEKPKKKKKKDDDDDENWDD